MFLIVGGWVPVTGMLAGMNLSKPGINLSKPGMNLSKPGKKHRNHVIMNDYIPHGTSGVITYACPYLSETVQVKGISESHDYELPLVISYTTAREYRRQ